MNKKQGFTLIELLLVISVITLLSTFSFFHATEAKKKGEDSHMKAEAREVRNAIELYKLDNDGRVPGNTSGQMVQEGSSEYASAMNELVDDGYLSEVPTSPSGDSYAYMTNSDGTEGVFAASLNFESSDSSTNSCTNVGTNLTYGTCTYIYNFDLSGGPFNARNLSCDELDYSDDEECLGNVSTSEFTSNCTCSLNNQYSNSSSFPDSACELIYQKGIENINSGSSLENVFGDTEDISCSDMAPYTTSFTSKNAVICEFEEESVCGGSSNSDYCTCL